MKQCTKHFFHFLLFGHLQQRKQMLNVRVHSAVAEQSKEMQLPGSSALHCLLKQRHAWQLLVGDQQVNARDVHVHDAPCAHVHVPHFAIAHLAFGQSDKRPGGMNQSVWKFLNQFVIRRLARQGDGVPLVSARYPHPSSTVSTMGFGRLLIAVKNTCTSLWMSFHAAASR